MLTKKIMKNVGIISLVITIIGVIIAVIQYIPEFQNKPPTVMINATPKRGFIPLTVNFSAEGSDPENGSDVDYYWKYGYKSEASYKQNPIFTYSSPGVYTVVLNVTDRGGKTATKTITIEALENNTPILQKQQILVKNDPNFKLYVSSKDTNIKRSVYGICFENYKIFNVLIYAKTDIYYKQALTSMNSDGIWSCDVFPGRLYAYLVDKDYSDFQEQLRHPPKVDGQRIIKILEYGF